MVDPAQKCEQCGENLVPGARFCESCRHPVSAKAVGVEKKSVFSRFEKRDLIWAVISIVFLLVGSILGIQYQNSLNQDIKVCDEHLRVGEYFEALACYDKVIAASPPNSSNAERSYYKKGDIMNTNKLGETYIFKKAADCFKESYRLSSGNQSSLILQGLNLYWANQFNESIDRLNEVKNKSCDCRIYQALSASYNKTGRPQMGKENYYNLKNCRKAKQI
jgi:tetratricopeptide (TPR) repeat protein